MHYLSSLWLILPFLLTTYPLSQLMAKQTSSTTYSLPTCEQANALYDTFIAMYEEYGHEEYMIDEEITQANHVLQAAYFAQIVGAPEELVIGLLLHDIGQIAREEWVGQAEFLHGNHDDFGAEWLRERAFPPTLCDWVAGHAIAKLLLCEEEPSYYEDLSRASKASYWIQREKYSHPPHDVKMEWLSHHPLRELFKSCRRCDDLAKIGSWSAKAPREGYLELPSFESYRAMWVRVLRGEGAPASSAGWEKNLLQLQAAVRRDRPAGEELICTLPGNELLRRVQPAASGG